MTSVKVTEKIVFQLLKTIRVPANRRWESIDKAFLMPGETIHGMVLMFSGMVLTKFNLAGRS